jgi:hypothetical protein
VPELGLQPGHVIRQDGAGIEIYNPGSGPPRQFRLPASPASSLDRLEALPAGATTDPAGDLSEIP